MDTKKLASVLDWQKTNIVKGIKIEFAPVKGNACYHYVGSDIYGYQIGEVSEDGTKFEVLTDEGILYGTAILATRKNFKGKGKYYFMSDGKPSYYYSQGRVCGALKVTDEKGCGQTYLDPSF